MLQRRLLHHGPDPLGAPLLIQDRAIAGCWFELHRRGGCGAGEIVLNDTFPERHAIDIGDWVSVEAAPGERWYLGRVEERRSASPAQVRLRLEGMSVELTEVFPGGFASDADGAPPHRFAATDLFPNDPDHSLELFDSIDSVESLVRRLIQDYVVPATQIVYDPNLVEAPLYPAPVGSLKFRGEESVAAVLKELGLRAQASWGVDPLGRFFFLQPRSALMASWREGRDLTSLNETRDREHLFNRVLLTGDYVYDQRDGSFAIARRSYRWRGNYTQPESRASFGDRRIRLWVPWLRTEVDTLAFVREFFRIYSRPTARYQIETVPQTALPFPWLGQVRLQDRDGGDLFRGPIETVRIGFDHAPRFRLELGPEDPRDLWPEPPHDERWELPDGRPPGGGVSITDRTSSDPLTSTPESGGSSLASDDSSDHSLPNSSEQSSAPSSATHSSLGSWGSSENSSVVFSSLSSLDASSGDASSSPASSIVASSVSGSLDSSADSSASLGSEPSTSNLWSGLISSGASSAMPSEQSSSLASSDAGSSLGASSAASSGIGSSQNVSSNDSSGYSGQPSSGGGTTGNSSSSLWFSGSQSGFTSISPSTLSDSSLQGSQPNSSLAMSSSGPAASYSSDFYSYAGSGSYASYSTYSG